MKLHNSFDEYDLQKWFNWECWKCGQSHANCFHHIVGRGNGDSKCESSILNACPLNNFTCHLPCHGELRIEQNVKMLLQKTMRFLLKRGYVFNEIDIQFIEKYKNYYELIK